jgi:protein-tyrosine phosphatase
MIDIHSHILPEVDDGANTMAESIEMLEQAKRSGVKAIIATPHFNEDSYGMGLVEESFASVKPEAEKRGIALFLGYEIKIQKYPAQMPKEYSGLTLGNSRYLLIELPFSYVPEHTLELIYDLQLKRFIPILAHPERCVKLIKNKVLFIEILESGCLLQVDAASIIGLNGGKAKKFARKIIKKGNVSFIASDAHNPDGYSIWYAKAQQKVQKWIGKQKMEELFSSPILRDVFPGRI